MTPDPDLDRLLGAWQPPPLPAGFAERLELRIAAAEPLPPPTPRRHRLRGWGRGSRLIAGSIAVGLVTATVAAAAGVFGNVGITIPVWQQTVEKVTGLQLAEPAVVPQPPKPAPAVATAAKVTPPPSLREIVADGEIDSRAELEAASAALDARRDQRRALARDRREARVDAIVEDRRARGLPVPSDDALASARERRDARAARRAEAIDARRAEIEAEMGERIDNGESIKLRRPVMPEARAERRERFRAWRERQRAPMGERVPSPFDPDERFDPEQ